MCFPPTPQAKCLTSRRQRTAEKGKWRIYHSPSGNKYGRKTSLANSQKDLGGNLVYFTNLFPDHFCLGKKRGSTIFEVILKNQFCTNPSCIAFAVAEETTYYCSHCRSSLRHIFSLALGQALVFFLLGESPQESLSQI